ncbi:MAG: helix-turn-helix domain-containing protein [Verrucomicrobia bacterium]|nr:helix-turn-helix domain-containing protein [Verrucomicrobiota bacterium]
MITPHKSATSENNALLKPQEAADLIGVKKTTIWSYCRNGRLPHIRITPRCFRIRRSDLENYLNLQTR